MARELSATWQSDYLRRRYEADKQAGVCVRCGDKPKVGTLTCPGCAHDDRLRKAALNRRRYAAGLCVCGKEPRRTDRATGVVCGERAKARSAKSRRVLLNLAGVGA